MQNVEDYLETISNVDNRKKLKDLFENILSTFPTIEVKIAWNQPMFVNKNTYIIGFSVAKNHFAIAPEQVAIESFSDRIIASGYEHTKNIIKINWSTTINYDLIKDIIAFNISDKEGYTTFWRK